MLAPITIRYPFRPARRSLVSGEVADLFGLPPDDPPHTIAEDVALDIRPGDLALFTGPSGSGKSSLMREAGRQLNAIDATALDLPDVPLVDALPGTTEDRLGLLAACGLGEARLLLRTPGELSDGQRYRFRMTFALSRRSPILLDEFAAVLDRTLAKVLAFNLRKLVTRTGVGVLCATTHDDLVEDLNPDVHIRCLGDGEVQVTREPAKKNDRSASTTAFGCRTAPSPTGRTSLGGITGRTAWPASAA
jgi:ABC-type ATPase with predicted acetyltransferase domain